MTRLVHQVRAYQPRNFIRELHASTGGARRRPDQGGF
jgi:hypothetical protein